MADRIPSPEDIEHTLRDSGPLTLRALGRTLWPGVSRRTALSITRAWPGEMQASLMNWLAAQLRTLLEHHAVQVLPPPGGVNGPARRFVLSTTPWTPVLGLPTAVHGQVIATAWVYRHRLCFAVPQAPLPLLRQGQAVDVSGGQHQLAAVVEDVNDARPGAHDHGLAVVRADLGEHLRRLLALARRLPQLLVSRAALPPALVTLKPAIGPARRMPSVET